MCTGQHYGFAYQQQSSCNYDKQSRGASISGTVSIASGSESNLEAAVANVGPVAVAIDGASNAFRVSMNANGLAPRAPFITQSRHHNILTHLLMIVQFYYSGVYDSSRCSSSSLNHAMVVTGYGGNSGKYYWLAKNRFGCMYVPCMSATHTHTHTHTHTLTAGVPTGDRMAM